MRHVPSPRLRLRRTLDVSIGVNGVGLGADRRFAPANTIPFVKRNSQTILNIAFNGIDQSGHYDPATAPMFWDLRVVSLEAQALEPIKSFEEMRGDAYGESDALDEVVARGWRGSPSIARSSRTAFGGAEPVTADNLGKALAAFQRSARRHQLALRSLHARRPQRDDERTDQGHGDASIGPGARTATPARCSPTSSRTCSAWPTTPR